MNIAICDDNLLDRELIVDLLECYFFNKSISYSIDQYENGDNLIYEIEDGHPYDIIILDIFMGKLLGIEVAKNLRKLKFNGEIIFLTASSDFAVDSYDVNAGGYILKPISYNKLKKVIDKVTLKLGTNSYCVRQRSNFLLIPYNEIVYIESNNSKCILHRNNGEKYNIYKKLNEIESELNDSRFLRSHQSYLVNMDYIIEAGNQFQLSTGDVVLIRQRHVKEIRNQYLDNKDYDSAFNSAHNLKGLAQNLGFTKLAKSSEKLSNALRSDNQDVLMTSHTLINDVIADYKEVKAAIKKLKKQLK